MSGRILSEIDELPPNCQAGHFARRKSGGGWECVAYTHLVPIDLIIQGDCDGVLAVRLTYIEAINPPDRAGRPQLGRTEIALDGLPLSLGIRELKSRLETALRGVVSPRRALSAKAAPRPRTKAKPKAKVTRKRKTARKKK
jgi:hypothetical protein